jgi:5-methylthioadenosine/S-adenosylhomocysteine deaminase
LKRGIMNELVIKNGHVLTPDMQLTRVDVSVDGGVITRIGDSQGGEQIIDARGCIVMPGLINTHTHTPMTLLRGICRIQGFEQWRDCILAAESKITPSEVYTGALLACVEMIKSGTTTFADMYIHMDEVASAVKESGLRSVLGWGIIEGVGEALPEKLTHRRRFVREYNNAAGGRITTMYSPHSPSSCSSKALSLVAELAKEDSVPVMMHLLETRKEAEALETQGYHLSLLEETGLLSGRLIAAHCVHANKRDIRTLAQKGVSVSCSPVSNLRLGVGTADITTMFSEGINLCLGSDGAEPSGSLDMFTVMRIAALLANSTTPAVIPSGEILKMATVNGAKALGLNTGRIEVGCRADVILVDMKKPHLTGHAPLDALVYSASGSDVKTSIVDGRVVMESYEIKTLSEEDTVLGAQESVKHLKQRLNTTT